MDIVKKNWALLKEFCFSDSDRKLALWIVFTSLFIYAASAIALSTFSPFLSYILAGAIVLHLSSLMIKKKIILIGVWTVFIFGVLFLLSKEMKENMIWNLGWIITVILSLGLQYESVQEAIKKTGAKEQKLQETEKNVDLWKSRFETVKEKMISDREVLEREIEEMYHVQEESVARVHALQELAKLSHLETKKAEEKIVFLSEQNRLLKEVEKDSILSAKEFNEVVEDEVFMIDGKVIDKDEMTRIIEELNTLRCDYLETKNLLEEARNELQTKEEVIRLRQERNQSLFSKSKKPISLQDLSKGL